MEDTILRLIEQLPLSGAIIVLMFWFIRRLLSIWSDYLKNENLFRKQLLELYGNLEGDNDTLKDGMVDLAKQLTLLQNNTDQFVNRMAGGLSEIDATLRRLRESNRERLDTFQEFQDGHQAELTALRDEVKNQMGDLKKDNQDIQEQLRELTTQLKNLTDTLEAAEISRAIQFFQEYSEIPKQANSLLQEIKSAVERLNEDQGKEQS